MNPTIKTNTGNSEKAKSDYAEVFLTRVPIKHQRCIGITEKPDCTEQHYRKVVCQCDPARASQRIQIPT